MREIKFLSHLPRNAVLLFFFYASLNIVNDFYVTSSTFVLSAVAITFVYAPVYFINDFFDREEDRLHRKSNLFLSIKNPVLYWTIAGGMFTLGFYISISINPQSALTIFLVYLFNALYTIKPFRLRDKVFLREITLFVIYVFKSMLILQLLNYSFDRLSLYLIILMSVTSAYSLTIYKRHLKKSIQAEYVFGVLFYTTLAVTLFKHPNLTLFLFPMAPLSFYLAKTNKNEQVFLGAYELLYLIWGICVFLFMNS